MQPHDMSSKDKIRQSNILDPDQPDKTFERGLD